MTLFQLPIYYRQVGMCALWFLGDYASPLYIYDYICMYVYVYAYIGFYRSQLWHRLWYVHLPNCLTYILTYSTWHLISHNLPSFECMNIVVRHLTGILWAILSRKLSGKDWGCPTIAFTILVEIWTMLRATPILSTWSSPPWLYQKKSHKSNIE